MNRRDFLKCGGSCVAHVTLISAAMPRSVAAVFAQRTAGDVVALEPWGRLERIADGVWALISTPLAGGPDAMRTFSNGGIVAGRSGTLVVEGSASEDGARWMWESARRLTGRAPTHVVLTHAHGDHSSGLSAYASLTPQPLHVTTDLTRSRLAGSRTNVASVLTQAELIAPGSAETIDLGGRKVRVTARAGHTSSDLSIAVEDPHVVFGGDLLWNGFFPNYVDAVPSVLSRAVRALGSEDRNAKLIPGHGSIPSDAEFAHYLELLDLVEDAARRAHAAGITAEQAAKTFRVPDSLGAWTLFGPNYYVTALHAWERELSK